MNPDHLRAAIERIGIEKPSDYTLVMEEVGRMETYTKGETTMHEPKQVAVFRRAGLNTWIEPKQGYDGLSDRTPLFASECEVIYTLVRLDETDTDKVVEIISAHPSAEAAERAEELYRAKLQHLVDLQTDVIRTDFVASP